MVGRLANGLRLHRAVAVRASRHLQYRAWTVSAESGYCKAQNDAGIETLLAAAAGTTGAPMKTARAVLNWKRCHWWRCGNGCDLMNTMQRASDHAAGLRAGFIRGVGERTDARLRREGVWIFILSYDFC